MNIQNAQYKLDQGHPYLELTIDGSTVLISAEIKPTLVRHGLIPVSGLPGVRVTNDPGVFRLTIAFGLECYHGRFKEGAAVENPDPQEVGELGDRLAEYTLENAPTWASLTSF